MRCPNPKALKDFRAGNLDGLLAEAIRYHVEQCLACQRESVRDAERRAPVVAETLPATSTTSQVSLTAPLYAGAARNPGAFQNRGTATSKLTCLKVSPPPPPSPARRSNAPASAPRLAEPSIPRALMDHLDSEVIGELGQGGIGIVCRARNRLLERLEVLKVPTTSLLEHPNGQNRFLREIRAARV